MLAPPRKAFKFEPYLLEQRLRASISLLLSQGLLYASANLQFTLAVQAFWQPMIIFSKSSREAWLARCGCLKVTYCTANLLRCSIYRHLYIS